MATEFLFGLGDTVKDRVTGFTGVVMARVQYITGCNQYHVQPPKLKAGALQDGHYFDEMRLDWVAGPKVAVKRRKTGGPSSIEPRRK